MSKKLIDIWFSHEELEKVDEALRHYLILSDEDEKPYAEILQKLDEKLNHFL